MNTRKNNNIIVNLNKVSYASFGYKCLSLGRTYFRTTKPTQPTVNGHEFDCEVLRFGSEETMLQYAKRRDLLDCWYPELTLQLSNNHSLIYTGNKAISLWEAWKALIFSKQNKQKGKK